MPRIRAGQLPMMVELPTSTPSSNHQPQMVDLNTESGAVEFLQHAVPKLFNQLVENIQEKRNLYSISMMSTLARSLQKNHSELISDEEIANVGFMYTKLMIEFSNQDSWKTAGQLDVFHHELIGSITPFAQIPRFTRFMLKKGGFTALARVMQVCQPFPCTELCGHVLAIIWYAYTSALTDDTETSIMYKLDKTGIVAQALRALTAPVPTDDNMEGFLDLLNHMMQDLGLIKKRLQPGMATRVVLDALLDGSDGYKGRDEMLNPKTARKVRERLQLLADKCNLDFDKLDHMASGLCRNCRKPSPDLQRCSRCKTVYYCSRKCQAANWKTHKKFCKQYRTQETDQTPTLPLSHVTQEWIHNHLPDIFRTIEQMLDSHDSDVESLKDVVVLVDLIAYKDPPVVIKKYADVMQGNRPAMPRWGGENNTAYLLGIQERHESMTDDMLMFIHRSHDCDYGVCSMTFGRRET